MKALFLILSFASFSALAQEEPSPFELCEGRFCTKEMHNILSDFSEATHQPSFELAGFSGSCFHIHPNLSPDKEHHGVMLLRDSNPNKRFTGLFSFFTPENPYQDLSLHGLRDFFDERGSRQHPVRDIGAFESVLIESESARIFYWFKTNPDGAWLVSKWDFKGSLADVRIFCHFPKVHRN